MGSNSNRSNAGKIVLALLFIFSVYCVAVFTIMRFQHPDYTETELFLSFAKAFILDFS